MDEVKKAKYQFSSDWMKKGKPNKNSSMDKSKSYMERSAVKTTSNVAVTQHTEIYTTSSHQTKEMVITKEIENISAIKGDLHTDAGFGKAIQEFSPDQNQHISQIAQHQERASTFNYHQTEEKFQRSKSREKSRGRSRDKSRSKSRSRSSSRKKSRSSSKRRKSRSSSDRHKSRSSSDRKKSRSSSDHKKSRSSSDRRKSKSSSDHKKSRSSSSSDKRKSRSRSSSDRRKSRSRSSSDKRSKSSSDRKKSSSRSRSQRSNKNSGIFSNSEKGGRGMHIEQNINITKNINIEHTVQVNEWEQKYHQLLAQSEAHSKQNHEFKLALEHKQVEIHEQQVTVQSYHQKIQIYETQISQHTQEIEQLNLHLSQKKESTESSAELDKQRIEFQMKIEKLTIQIEETKKIQISESETLKKQNFDLESKVQHLGIQLTDKEAQITSQGFESSTQIEDLQEQNAQLAKQLEAYKHEEGQKELLEIKLKSMQEDSTQMQIKIQEACHHEFQIEALNKEISELEKNKFDLEYQITQLNSKVSDQVQMTMKITELQNVCDDCTDKNTKLTETRDQHQEQIIQLMVQIDSEKLKALKVTEERESWEAERKIWQNEKERIDETNSKFVKQQNQSFEMIQNLTCERDQLQQDVEGLSVTVAELVEKIRLLRQSEQKEDEFGQSIEVMQLQDKVKELERRVTKKKLKIATFKETMQAKQSVNTNEPRDSSYEEQITSFQGRITASQEKATELEQKLKASEDLVFSANENITQMQQTIQELERRVTKKKLKIANFKETTQNVQSTTSYEQKITHLEQTIANLEEKRVITIPSDNNSYLNISNHGEQLDLDQYDSKDQELHQKFVSQIQLIHDQKSRTFQTPEEELRSKSKLLEQMIKIMSQKIILKNNQIDGLQLVLKNKEFEKQSLLEGQQQVTSESDDTRVERLTSNVQKLQDKDDMNQLEIYKMQQAIRSEKDLVKVYEMQIKQLEAQTSSNVIIKTGESQETTKLHDQIQDLERRIGKKKLKISTFKENSQIQQDNIQHLTEEVTQLNKEMDEMEEEAAAKEEKFKEIKTNAGVEFVEVEKVIEIPIEIVKEIEIIKEVIKEVKVPVKTLKPKTNTTETQTFWRQAEKEKEKTKIIKQELPKQIYIDQDARLQIKEVNLLLTNEQNKTLEFQKEIKNLKYVIGIQQGRIQKLGNRSLSRPSSRPKSKIKISEQQIDERSEKRHKIFVEHDVKMFSRSNQGSRMTIMSGGKQNETIESIREIEQESEMQQNVHRNQVQELPKETKSKLRYKKRYNYNPPNNIEKRIEVKQKEVEKEVEKRAFVRNHTTAKLQQQYSSRLMHHRSASNFSSHAQLKHEQPFMVPKPKKQEFRRLNHAMPMYESQKLEQVRGYESQSQLSQMRGYKSGSETLSIQLHSHMFSPSRAFEQKAQVIQNIHQRNLEMSLRHQSQRIQEMPIEESFIVKDGTFGPMQTHVPAPIQTHRIFEAQNKLMRDNSVSVMSMGSKGSMHSPMIVRDEIPNIIERETVLSAGGRRKRESRQRPVAVRNLTPRLFAGDMSLQQIQTHDLQNRVTGHFGRNQLTPQPTQMHLEQSREVFSEGLNHEDQQIFMRKQELGTYTGGDIHVGDLNQRYSFNSPDTRDIHPTATNRFSERQQPIKQMLKSYRNIKQDQQAFQTGSKIMETKYLNEPLSYNYDEHAQTSRVFDKQNVKPRYLDYTQKIVKNNNVEIKHEGSCRLKNGCKCHLQQHLI